MTLRTTSYAITKTWVEENKTLRAIVESTDAGKAALAEVKRLTEVVRSGRAQSRSDERKNQALNRLRCGCARRSEPRRRRRKRLKGGVLMRYTPGQFEVFKTRRTTAAQSFRRRVRFRPLLTKKAAARRARWAQVPDADEFYRQRQELPGCVLRMKRWRKAAAPRFVCDRTTLINQTSDVAFSYGLSAHGVIQSNHPPLQTKPAVPDCKRSDAGAPRLAGRRM